MLDDKTAKEMVLIPHNPNDSMEVSARKRIRNRTTAIRAMCITCVGSYPDIAGCTAYQCPLYPFRMGKDPYTKKKGPGFGKTRTEPELHPENQPQ